MLEYLNHILNYTLAFKILIVVFFVIFLIQLYFYLRYFNGINRYNRKINKNKIGYTTTRPPVSVVVCSRNEAENLERFLPSILEQDYPTYEVIVVNDGSTDESSDLLNKLSEKYSHLYHTFLPMDAKYLSRKKMCLTVGIKAAHYEHLLLIDADCEPAGKDWISNMVRNYVNGTDIVLGYGGHKYKEGFLNKLISFDTLFIAIQYMGFALKGKTYMGVGRNLSYKKELFFKNRGFASHLDLASGDDDLFIKEVSTPKNVRIEFSQPSITWSSRKMTLKSFLYQKERHLSTSPKYNTGTKCRIGAEVLSRGLFYALFLLIEFSLLIYCEFITAGIIGALFIIRFLTQFFIINKTAKLLNEKKLTFSLILFDILLPLITLHIFTIGKIGEKKDSMWR